MEPASEPEAAKESAPPTQAELRRLSEDPCRKPHVLIPEPAATDSLIDTDSLSRTTPPMSQPSFSTAPELAEILSCTISDAVMLRSLPMEALPLAETLEDIVKGPRIEALLLTVISRSTFSLPLTVALSVVETDPAANAPWILVPDRSTVPVLTDNAPRTTTFSVTDRWPIVAAAVADKELQAIFDPMAEKSDPNIKRSAHEIFPETCTPLDTDSLEPKQVMAETDRVSRITVVP